MSKILTGKNIPPVRNNKSKGIEGKGLHSKGQGSFIAKDFIWLENGMHIKEHQG